MPNISFEMLAYLDDISPTGILYVYPRVYLYWLAKRLAVYFSLTIIDAEIIVRYWRITQ